MIHFICETLKLVVGERYTLRIVISTGWDIFTATSSRVVFNGICNGPHEYFTNKAHHHLDHHDLCGIHYMHHVGQVLHLKYLLISTDVFH